MTGDKSRAQLAQFAMRMDAGDYFTKNGKMDPNLGLDYFKTDMWELDPLKKGPEKAQVFLMDRLKLSKMRFTQSMVRNIHARKSRLPSLRKPLTFIFESQ